MQQLQPSGFPPAPQHANTCTGRKDRAPTLGKLVLLHFMSDTFGKVKEQHVGRLQVHALMPANVMRSWSKLWMSSKPAAASPCEAAAASTLRTPLQTRASRLQQLASSTAWIRDTSPCAEDRGVRMSGTPGRLDHRAARNGMDHQHPGISHEEVFA